jgi:hypothetical protein
MGSDSATLTPLTLDSHSIAYSARIPDDGPGDHTLIAWITLRSRTPLALGEMALGDHTRFTLRDHTRFTLATTGSETPDLSWSLRSHDLTPIALGVTLGARDQRELYASLACGLLKTARYTTSSWECACSGATPKPLAGRLACTGCRPARFAAISCA